MAICNHVFLASLLGLGCSAQRGPQVPLAESTTARSLVVPQDLPTIERVPGVDPNGAATCDELTQARNAFAAQNWRDAETLFRQALARGLQRDPAWEASTQIMQCALRLGEFDRAVVAAIDTAGRFLDTRDEARAMRVLGNLYLALPHWGTEQAQKLQRGEWNQGRYRDVRHADQRLAVLAHERARDLFAAHASDATLHAERLEQLFDLVTAVTSFGPYDLHSGSRYGSWGMSEDDEQDWPAGIPVSEDGRAQFEPTPEAYALTLTLGQKMKFLLGEIEQLDRTDPRDFAARSRLRRAALAKNRYGPDRLARDAWRHVDATPTEVVPIDTLADDEALTIVGTRTLVVKLPPDEDVLALLASVERDFPHSTWAGEGRYAAGVYRQSRQQFTRAIDDYRALAQRHPEDRSRAEAQIAAIEAREAYLEPMQSQLLGDAIAIKLAHRNMKQVHLRAQEVDLERYVRDAWRDLESSDDRKHYSRDPGNLSWEMFREEVSNHPRYLDYVTSAALEWVASVADDGTHRYAHTSVPFPGELATHPGCWVVEVAPEDCLDQHSRNLVLIQDLALVEKRFKNQSLYLVTDARDGAPIAGATVRVLQYWQHWQKTAGSNDGKWIYEHRNVDQATDANGIALVSSPSPDVNPQCVAMVALQDSRIAFSGVHYLSTYSLASSASENRVLVVTDRPVYRPGQQVQLRAWLRTTEDGAYRAPRAESLSYTVIDPRNERIAGGPLAVDADGSVTLTIALDAQARLGMYQVSVSGAHRIGGNAFRVEAYRKPEFEVTVTAAATARLGERIAATIKATYLFGAPVSDARLAYQIFREPYAAQYFAPGAWDWLYGLGYGSCFYAYDFYPWWDGFGCSRWMPWMPRQPARELVSEGEGRLGADGTLAITIDTQPALRDHPDTDHRYVITAQVTDTSRRTIPGEGLVIVTRHEFQTYVDVDRGYYQPGDEMVVTVKAMTATGVPVATRGRLTFTRIPEQAAASATITDAPESAVDLETDADGNARMTLRPRRSGQFLARFTTRDSRGDELSGATVVWVCGADFDGAHYHMNDLEILTDKRTYAAGETARVLLHSNQPNAHVLFASRAEGGTLLDHRLITLVGKSAAIDLPITKGDTPNFFIEAATVFAGNVHQETREVLVPPQESTLDVSVSASKSRFAPGEACELTVTTSTADGKPARAQVAVSVFDRAVLQIEHELTPDPRMFFWGNRRYHQFLMTSNLRFALQPTSFGHDPAHAWPAGTPKDWDGGFEATDTDLEHGGIRDSLRGLGYAGGKDGRVASLKSKEDAAAPAEAPIFTAGMRSGLAGDDASSTTPAWTPATTRKQFADTAHWTAALDTTDAGRATITFKMPENLTTWRVKAIGLTAATRAGQGDTSIITTKDFLVRIAAPRFLTERDEVTLSAIVHNSLASSKHTRVTLALPLNLLEPLTPATVTTEVASGGEARVDWRVRVRTPGLATIHVEALTDEQSDATELAFPVLVHGFMKTVARTGSVKAGTDHSTTTIEIPAERRIESTSLEMRISPSLALAMLDALPYLIHYPYGCTEQTMSRFMPAVLTMKTLQDMGVTLDELGRTHTNLNAQQTGAHRYDPEDRNQPGVFSDKELAGVVRAGLQRIAELEHGGGGWGWWANDQTSTHLTAYVMWGLIEARNHDIAVDSAMMQRGFAALAASVSHDLEAWRKSGSIANTQAWLAYVLSLGSNEERGDAKLLPTLLDLVFERRIHLSLYGKALLSLALRNAHDAARADLVLQNARQKEIADAENDTVSYPIETSTWWCWWNNDVETMAWMLRAIIAKDASDPAAPGLVKWLLNHRHHGRYWRSTRDTSITIAAFRDYLRATHESTPDLTVRVSIDRQRVTEVRITKANVFTFDNRLVVPASDLATGVHEVTIERQGTGSLYWNLELSYFTLEEHVQKTGLEIKVDRTYYRLERDDATAVVPGERLQPVSERRVHYRRVPVTDGDRVTSGDLLEVELKIAAKNDYDYLVFEDPKPAGCEPIEVRSGARWGELCSNMELRDDKVALFVTWLERGEHAITYRVRAEAPGVFHTLPTRGYAMYAPELKANAEELVLEVADR